jgi:hypothetical protein
VFFALHPATLSILPYPARRTETLMLLFVALALLALPTRAAGSARRGSMLAGILALGAAMSKETGVIAVPLIFTHQLVFSEAAAPARRVVDSALFAMPAAVFSLAFVGLRFMVIGGMGGYHIGSDAPYATKVMMFGPQYLTATLASGDFDVPGSRGPIALLICVGIAAVALLLVRRGGEPTHPTAPRTLQTLCVAGGWLAGSLLLACLSMQFSPRYVMPMSLAVGMLLGALLEGARFELLERAGASRALALGAVGAIALSAFVALNGTALATPYHELRQATRTQRQLLAALSHRIGRATDFEYIHVDLQRRVPVEARAVDDLWMIAPWGLEAWLELTHPERPYTVSKTTRLGVPTAEYWSVTLNPKLNPKRSDGSEQGDG